jgi:hypothetical protein
VNNIITISKKQELYGLKNIYSDQLVYCSKDNVFYHLINLSRKHKVDGWEIVGTDNLNAALEEVFGDYAPRIHDLIDTTNHPVSGLTTGHFLKATSATTYGFSAHGLDYNDVNAIAQPSSASVDREILIWDGTGHDKVLVSTGSTISSAGHLSVTGNVIAYQTSPPSSSFWDDMPAATNSTMGGFILDDSQMEMNAGVLSILDSVLIPADHDIVSAHSATCTSGQFLKATGTNTFAWSAHGLVASDVGLGNVTNESKTTMFTNPTFTGDVTVTGSTNNIKIGEAGGYYGFGISSSGAAGGGWARRYGFYNKTTNAVFGGFGALGSNDSLSYLWIGRDYNDYCIIAYLDGGIGLNYDNSQKLETVNTGVVVTGHNYIRGVGNGVYFDTTGVENTNYIATVSDYNMQLYVGRGTTTKIVLNNNGPVELYHGSNKKLETSANGVVVTGNHESTRILLFSDDTTDCNLTIGAGSPGVSYGQAWIGNNIAVGGPIYGRINTGSAASLIELNLGILNFAVYNSSGTKYDGLSINAGYNVSSQHFYPNGDNTYYLGYSTLRWATIYGTNASLSNTLTTAYINLNDSNTLISEGTGNAVKVTTDSGYIEIGPQNSGYSHFITDRSSYYFNKRLIVDEGIISSYDEDLVLQRATTTKVTIGSSSATFENTIYSKGNVIAYST